MAFEPGTDLPRFHAVLLAGGQSSRMGRDKAELLLGGQSLLERALDLLHSTRPTRLLLSGRTGVPDLFPFSGPPGGLYSILDFLKQEDALDSTPLLLIPVDMPLLNRSLLLHLLQALGDAEAARFEEEVFPCVFRASSVLYEHLQALFAQSAEPGGKRSMKALFAFTDARSVSREGWADELFLNVNRPQEWEAMRNHLGVS